MTGAAAGMGYEIGRDGDVTIVRFTSPPVLATLAAAIAEVDRLDDSVLELWDVGASGLKLPTEEIKELARLARDKVHRPRKTAILASDDLGYGLSRMYSAYREEPDTRTRVFTSEATARTWLHEPE